jgi:hypothetical protein
MDKSLDKVLKNGSRTDRGIGFLLKVLLFNNRFKYYDLYLKLAKQKGYIITNYADYLEKYHGSINKLLILRHDVEIFPAIPGLCSISKRVMM